jgi:hypothetical protein
MVDRLSAFFRSVVLACVLAGAAIGTAGAQQKVTQCTNLQFCYCVQQDLLGVIRKHVDDIRMALQVERTKNKAIGYLSVPISSLDGSDFATNVQIAAGIKKAVEARFGSNRVWMLDPADSAWSLPKTAKGADYMLMWTQVLEGLGGTGSDFDFFYFAGPRDVAGFFGLKGTDDMEALARHKNDPGFVKYYALRASTAFSYGAHDEWNIAQALNKKRRGADPAAGLAQQIAIFFDGQAVAPPLYEMSVQAGTTGACP